ncbi:lipopolysaccharide biosynthesis protein [Tenacibaculum sp. TC6]|uniref:lipopolysaccharide biosynthesis protein n=1 Tax=Tenacibaculum sp. TC6 TaxID=3423223 RepID=UPI003D36A61E
MGIIFKQSLKNTLIIYLGFLIGGINTIFLYTRFLKDDYYGLVTYVLSSSNLIMPFTALGIHFTIVKFFSSYKTKEEKDKFLSSVILLPLVIALIMGYFWNYFHNWIMAFVSKENTIVENYTIYIYSIAVSCAYFEVFYSWAKVQMQSVFGNLLKELYNRAAVTILLFAVYFNWITKQEFISFLSYAYILRTIIMMLYALKLYLPKFYFSLPENYGEIMRYTLYIILAGSASAIILDIDKFMIAGKDTFDKAAYYSVAVFIGSFIEAPSRAMTQILQPLTSKSINENNSSEVENLYKKSSINLLLVGGLFFILINCNVSELFKIMPKGYAGGELVVLMISAAKLFTMALGNNGAIINNSQFYRITLFTGAGMAILVWVLNKYFYYNLNYGTEGLAFATFLSFIIFGIFKVWYVDAKLHMFPFTKQTLHMTLIIVLLYLSFNYWDFNVGNVELFNFSVSPIINIILKSSIITLLYIYIVYKMKISDQINNLMARFL